MASGSPMCELCEEPQHVATHRCLDCEQNMCGLVAKPHLKARATQGHRVVETSAAAAAADGQGSSTRPVRIATCEVHVGMSLQLYDRQLRQAICAFCVVQPEHKGHDFVPLHEVAEQVQAELMARTEHAKVTLQAMRKSEAENRSALLALDVAVDAAEAKLRAAGEQVVLCV